MKQTFILFCIIFICLLSAAKAEALVERSIAIKNHHFKPNVIEAPAGTRIRLIVDNQDPTAEEFESHDLNREKIITGNSKAIILLSPLAPGEYKFFGEFHEDEAQGKLIIN